MSYKVTARSAENKPLSLNENDPALSVIQNVAIILSTKQGTIPLYRDFGLPMRFIDKPINVAETIMAAEITEALRTYEPCAKIKNIGYETDENEPGKLIPAVEVEIINEKS